MIQVAEVAVQVAAFFTTATRKKPYAARVSGLWVAEVAVLQTSQPKKSLFGCKLEICLQVMIAVGINTAVTATFATYAAKSLVITGLSGVVVPGNAATRVATHCYPQHQFRREENRQWYITRHYRS